MKIKIDVKGFVKKVVRVLKLSTKPSKEEFIAVAKITGLGIIVIGLVGYVITSLSHLLK